MRALVFAAVAAAALTACSPSLPAPSAAASPADVSALRIAPDGSGAGYSRAKFGVATWPDGPDGCNVRDEALARDLMAVTKHGRCDVTAGTLVDPYSGRTVAGKTSGFPIDHVYALELAWKTGAASWSPAQREAFATDSLELQATTTAENEQKSAKPPEQWMPAAGRCAYAQRFTALAVKYRLSVTAARADALRHACP